MNIDAGSYQQQQRLVRRVPGVSLTLFLVAILIFLWPRLTNLLQYDRAAVLDGEFWRVFTCQWTHWNFSHVVWDALMLLILGALCEQVRRKSFLACVVVSAVLIPIAGAVALPQMHYYRGLSGLDSALFVLLAVQLIRMNRSRDRVIATAAAAGLGAFALKTAYECITGSIIFVRPESVFTPVPLAHIVGGAIGLVIAAQGGSHEHTYQPAVDRPDQARPSANRGLCFECSRNPGI
ncbi:MAG: rhombosortase [Phycisphaerales bacterium]|nr:MAG: rhombosortase [Phycisphaerales bacterium]